MNVRRFADAFLDYWIDVRKIEDSTPSAPHFPVGAQPMRRFQFAVGVFSI